MTWTDNVNRRSPSCVSQPGRAAKCMLMLASGVRVTPTNYRQTGYILPTGDTAAPGPSPHDVFVEECERRATVRLTLTAGCEEVMEVHDFTPTDPSGLSGAPPHCKLNADWLSAGSRDDVTPISHAQKEPFKTREDRSCSLSLYNSVSVSFIGINVRWGY